MFGKPHEISAPAMGDTVSLEDILGDEVAAEQAHEVNDLRRRVEQVESQISSQFTSLATYVQIAQEQVELARAEARAATERSEGRLISLLERERADRLAVAPNASTGAAQGVTERLEALEQCVTHVTRGLDECRRQQLDLAVAITAMFERLGAPSATSADAFEAPSPETVASFDTPAFDGPIADLALNG